MGITRDMKIFVHGIPIQADRKFVIEDKMAAVGPGFTNVAYPIWATGGLILFCQPVSLEFP